MMTAIEEKVPTRQQAPSSATRPILHAVMRYVINPLVSVFLRSPLRGGITRSMMLITFTGRKSGKKYSTPVTYFEEGEELVVFTRAPWWKNLAGGAKVTLHLRGRKRDAHAEAISEPKRLIEHHLRTMREKHPRETNFLGLTLDIAGNTAPDEVTHAAEHWKVLRITPV